MALSTFQFFLFVVSLNSLGPPLHSFKPSFFCFSQERRQGHPELPSEISDYEPRRSSTCCQTCSRDNPRASSWPSKSASRAFVLVQRNVEFRRAASKLKEVD